ncbi:putative membrane protein [Lentzea californiensis]|nr:putative membrane protein [Lentzea californiensis]
MSESAGHALPPSAPEPATLPGRSLVVCAVIGAALMAAVDEIVFHQILAWHHFFDRSTPAVGLVSDGLLHTAELLGLVAGFVLYADLRRRDALAPAHAWAGLFLGLGGFQLFDGIVDHKVLRLHQVRYGVDLLVYDLVWNGAALALLAVGIVLAVRARRRASS